MRLPLTPIAAPHCFRRPTATLTPGQQECEKSAGGQSLYHYAQAHVKAGGDMPRCRRAPPPKQIFADFQDSLRNANVSFVTMYCMQRNQQPANVDDARDRDPIVSCVSPVFAATGAAALGFSATNVPRGHDPNSRVGTPGRLKLLETLRGSGPEWARWPSLPAGFASEPFGARSLPRGRLEADVSPPTFS